MEIAFKWWCFSNNSEITYSFLQNRANGRIFRTGLLLSTMKLAYIALGVWNKMEIVYKRRNISNKRDITFSVSPKSSKRSHFAYSWACFDAKSGVRSNRRVKRDGNGDLTLKYLPQDVYIAQFSSKSRRWSHFSRRSASFDAEPGVHSTRRVKWNGNSV